MRWSSVVFLVPAAALATVWGCGGTGDTAASGTTSGGGAATTATSGTGGAATTASGTGGSASATSSGQGGSATTTSTGSGTSSSATSSGTGSTACTWGAVNTCAPGMYCDAPGCQQGTCAPIGGAETSDRTPVCGCDNVTYWNTSVAASNGQSVSKASACMPGKTCGGFANLKCPGKADCAYQFADSNMCNAADIGGTCWVTPAVCPPVVVGSKAHACTSAKCGDECSLIKSSTSYYTDSTCPQ